MRRKIVVVGAGVVGVTCASRLSRDGHDVVLIERNEETATELTERLDVQILYGNGCSLSILREARIDQADLLLAVTDSDEVNMITALIAGSEFHVETKVVRLRSREHLQNIQELSKSWPGRTYGINPGGLAADRITSLLDVPHATNVARLLDGRVVVAGFRVRPDSPLAGKNMVTLRHLFPGTRILVAAIYRGGEALLPRGDTELRAGDIAYFSTVPDEVPNMVLLMGYTFDRDRMMVVSGGGRIARMVVRGALDRDISTTVLRRDRRRAERLAAEFPDAVVLQGDATDESLLREAGVESATSFVAATDDQETNLLSSVVAKRLGAGRVITLVDNPAYGSLVEGLGIDAQVSPRQAAVSEILRFVRGSHFEEVASLPGEGIEVAVVEVDEGSPLSGRPVRKLGLPSDLLITAVATADGVMIPHGDDVIPVGSRAVFFTLGRAAEKAARFLENRG